MADNLIKTTVEIDTNQAQRSIVQLNSIASNGTKTLEERIIAKNKAVELQNALSKKTIDALENERRTLEGRGATEKELKEIFDKLTKAKLDALKVSENSAKMQDKLNQAFEDGKNPVKNLDEATGGLISKFQLFLKNPIGIAITALVGLFSLFKGAVNRSEGATSSFNIIAAKFSGILNGVFAVLTPLVEFIGKKLVDALNNPKKAIIDLGDTIKENLVNRVKSFLVLGDAIGEFFSGNFKKAAKLATDGVIQFSTGVTNGADKMGKLIDSSKKLFNEAASATDGLANAERRLAKNRIDLEKQQLVSLRLAEQQRQIRDDTSKSMTQRMNANKELGKILDIQAKRELSIAGQTLSIEKMRKVANGDNIESVEAIGAAEVKLLEIRERITGQRSEQLVNETALIKEQSDLSLSILKLEFDNKSKLSELEIQRRKALGENTNSLEIELLKKRSDFEVSQKDLSESAKASIVEKYKILIDNLTLERNKKESDSRIALEEKDLQDRQANGENVLALQLEFQQRQRQAEVFKKDLTESEKALIDIKYHDLAEQTQLTYDEKELKAKRLKGENTFALELQQLIDKQTRDFIFLDAKKIKELENTELTESQRNEIINKYAVAREEIVRVSEKSIGDLKSKAIAKDMDDAAELFGVQRELAIARAIMAAPEAIKSSFKNAAELYAPPLSLAMGAIGAAGVVVPIAKGLADIKKVRFPSRKGKGGGGGGGGSISSAASSVSTAGVSSIAANNAARLGVDPSIGSNASANAANNVMGGMSQGIVFSESKYNEFKSQVKFKESKTKI
jgi:hypothetical protein